MAIFLYINVFFINKKIVKGKVIKLYLQLSKSYEQVLK